MVTSLATKRISAISQWQTFLKSFTHKMTVKASWHRNYVTITLCVLVFFGTDRAQTVSVSLQPVSAK